MIFRRGCAGSWSSCAWALERRIDSWSCPRASLRSPVGWEWRFLVLTQMGGPGRKSIFQQKPGPYCACFFSPTAKLAMGSLAQNSSGAIRCSCNSRFQRRFRRVPVQMMRFRRVPVEKADEVPESSGAEGSGGFRWRKLMKFQRVPSGADSRHGSGGFRCR